MIIPKTFFSSDKKSEGMETPVEMNVVDIPIDKEETEVKEENESLIKDEKQDNPLLLILEDIPSFVSSERTFNLKKDDVVKYPYHPSRICDSIKEVWG